MSSDRERLKTLFLGANGRGLGGDGNDKFFVGASGGNILSIEFI